MTGAGRSVVISHAVAADITLVRAFPINSGPSLDEPQCNLIAIDSTLYGTSTYGGDDANGQYGCVFKMSMDGSNLSFVHSFGYQDIDGMWPTFGLANGGATLYGVTFLGGSSVNYGTLYKVNTDGSNFSVLHIQSTTDNDIINSHPPVLVGSTLYGMAGLGGASSIGGLGAVYKIQTDGSAFELLHSFSSTGGYLPTGEPVVSGSTIFGTCESGGGSGYGTIFKMGVDGSGFTELHSFIGGSDGKMPWGHLTVSGSTIYGFTGAFSQGTSTIFKFNMDGSGYQSLATLPDGLTISYGGLTLVGDTLYGTTHQGGTYDRGTVFKIGVDGTGFSILDSFNGYNGADPQGGLLLIGSNLYGVTSGWGSPIVNNGTVFSIAIPEPSALVLLGIGAASLLAYVWRRRKRTV
jgi:uncharacterized repeat protein (TIGR03803 family)